MKRRPAEAAPLRPSNPGSAGRIVGDFLHVLRNQFYPDEQKAFYQQRSLLIQAITHPAAYLAARGVGLTEADHRKILTEQIRTIQHHGDTAAIRYFCRYFLHAIQQHMKFHGEDYYDSGKRIRDIADSALDSLKSRAASQALETTDRLAEINAIVRPPSRRKKPKAPEPSQPDLVGG